MTEVTHERMTTLEARVTALEATQRAGDTIQEHMVERISDLAENVSSLHSMFLVHINDERDHWDNELKYRQDSEKYRQEREESERSKRRADYIAFAGVLVTLFIGIITFLHSGPIP